MTVSAGDVEVQDPSALARVNSQKPTGAEAGAMPRALGKLSEDKPGS